MTREEMMLNELIMNYGMEHEAVIEFAEMVECGWAGEWITDRYNEAVERIEREME